MSTEVDTSLEIFATLQEEYDEDKECEHPDHSRLTAYHSGKAEWYVKFQCTVCLGESNLMAVCSKFMETSNEPIGCIGGCGMMRIFRLTVKERI